MYDNAVVMFAASKIHNRIMTKHPVVRRNGNELILQLLRLNIIVERMHHRIDAAQSCNQHGGWVWIEGEMKLWKYALVQ